MEYPDKLEAVAETIAFGHHLWGGVLLLCVKDKKLHIRPQHLGSTGYTLIRKINAREARTGLSSKQWDEIGTAIRKLQEDGLL